MVTRRIGRYKEQVHNHVKALMVMEMLVKLVVLVLAGDE
jgi:hypothetical protein